MHFFLKVQIFVCSHILIDSKWILGVLNISHIPFHGIFPPLKLVSKSKHKYGFGFLERDERDDVILPSFIGPSRFMYSFAFAALFYKIMDSFKKKKNWWAKCLDSWDHLVRWHGNQVRPTWNIIKHFLSRAVRQKYEVVFKKKGTYHVGGTP